MVMVQQRTRVWCKWSALDKARETLINARECIKSDLGCALNEARHKNQKSRSRSEGISKQRTSEVVAHSSALHACPSSVGSRYTSSFCLLVLLGE